MDHLTFTQQFLMALAHGGPPTVVAIFAYLKLKKKHEECHESMTVLLNGALQAKVKKAVEDALK